MTAHDAGAAGLGALLVLPLGLSDGGYFGRSFTALTVALAAIAALALAGGTTTRLSAAFLAAAVSLALLSAWVAVSSLWAVAGAGVELEIRRCVLYTAALVAVGVVVGTRGRRAFLLALTAAIAILGGVGIGLRALSGEPFDPYYGSLLAEPVGYPNAMGVLAATAAVLAIGLAGSVGPQSARALHALASVLVLVLGLTGSRGAALALGVGVAALVLLSDRNTRVSCVGRAAKALVLGGGSWGLVTVVGGSGLPLAGAVAGVAVCAAALPTPGRRATLALLSALVIGAVAGVAAAPPSTTSSFRSAYWAAALAEVRERPFTGSGAGSFYRIWREHRSVATEVRDAHSLYVETLSELGPVGLALVLTAVVIPLCVAVRRRGDPIGATAAAAFTVFAVHAALDWDWEMPVVTLVALGCSAVVLARERDGSRKQS